MVNSPETEAKEQTEAYAEKIDILERGLKGLGYSPEKAGEFANEFEKFLEDRSKELSVTTHFEVLMVIFPLELDSTVPNKVRVIFNKLKENQSSLVIVFDELRSHNFFFSPVDAVEINQIAGEDTLSLESITGSRFTFFKSPAGKLSTTSFSP